MNRQDKNYQKLYQYSIRKRNWGVGSVVVGIFLAGILQAPTVLANSGATASEPIIENQADSGGGAAGSSEVAQPAETTPVAQPATATPAPTESTTPPAETPETRTAEESAGQPGGEVAENAIIDGVRRRAHIDLTYNGALTSDSGQPVINAYDDNDATYWTSLPTAHNSESNPQHLITAFKEVVNVNRVEYTPRQHGAADVTGNVRKLKLYSSIDGQDWQLVTPLTVDLERGTINNDDKSITFPHTTFLKGINIQPVDAKYIKMVALETEHHDAAMRNKNVTAAEFIARGTRTVSARDEVGIRQVTATSHETNDGGNARLPQHAIDNNPTTFWQSEDSVDNRQNKQHLILELEEPARVGVIELTPRSEGGTATGNAMRGFFEYKLEESDEWQRVQLIGNATNNEFNHSATSLTKDVQFQPVIAKYFRLTVLNSHHWDQPQRGKIVAVGEIRPVAEKLIKESTVEVISKGEQRIQDSELDQGQTVVEEGQDGSRETILTYLTKNGQKFGDPILTEEGQVVEKRDTVIREGTRPVTPQPETPQPETPQPETPQPETPQPETPQPETPQPETPQPETPQPETPQPETPQPETPQPETPQPETPQPETPQPETPQPETPQPETPQPETPQPETPQPETPQPETPQPETPQPETPQPETPQPETPQPVVATKAIVPASAEKFRVHGDRNHYQTGDGYPRGLDNILNGDIGETEGFGDYLTELKWTNGPTLPVTIGFEVLEPSDLETMVIHKRVGANGELTKYKVTVQYGENETFESDIITTDASEENARFDLSGFEGIRRVDLELRESTSPTTPNQRHLTLKGVTFLEKSPVVDGEKINQNEFQATVEQPNKYHSGRGIDKLLDDNNSTLAEYHWTEPKNLPETIIITPKDGEARNLSGFTLHKRAKNNGSVTKYSVTTYRNNEVVEMTGDIVVPYDATYSHFGLNGQEVDRIELVIKEAKNRNEQPVSNQLTLRGFTLYEKVEIPETPQPETPQPETPQPETPQPETPQPETPQPETPQPETPQPETPQPETPQPETPQPETPQPETPQPETPQPETPQPETPQPETPQPETPQPETPQPETPQPETPQPETPQPETPQPETPQPETPQPETPQPETPQPETPQPETPQPETPQPETPQPETPQPETPQPETPQPETPQPETPQPETPQPETPQPETPQPETPQPETPQPETPQPETPQPETPQPETPQPETPQPETPQLDTTNRVFTDSPTGVTVEVTEGAESAIRLTVTPKTEVPETLADKDVDIYDLELVDDQDRHIDSEFTAKVKLPVDPDKVVSRVLFLPEGQPVEEIEFNTETIDSKPYVTFTATHFSDYAIVYNNVVGDVVPGGFYEWFIQNVGDQDSDDDIDELDVQSWLKGEKGEQGERGETGPKGPKGDTGDPGQAGAKGDQGLVGPRGPQGPAGPKGETGAQGPAGAKGDRGETGAQGPAGAKGDRGETGAQGPAGAKGDRGETGAQGPAGPKGDRGETGAQGPAGPKGDTGETGAQGPAGAKGDRGETGAQGPAGPKGDRGETGAQGPAGPKGDRGETGAQGPAGAKGDRGETGAQGPVGPRGPQGPKGNKGDRGLQGPKGDKGDTGAQGPKGDRGPVGPKGETTVLYQPVVLVDPTTNVSVTLSEGETNRAVALRVVHKETNATTTPVILSNVDYDLFDIELVDDAGAIVENTMPTVVRLPIDPGKEVARVVYLPNSAAEESLAFREVANGEGKEVEFVANHFSEYGIVYKEVTASEEIITAKGESVKAPALPALDLSAIKASHAPAVAAASAKKETLPETGVSESLALTALGLLGLAVAGKLAQRKKY
ncbi:discoidin domain-containing protein [Streptococcus suis]|nr:discoidin domain-containing protein [Streptococcus suis]